MRLTKYDGLRSVTGSSSQSETSSRGGEVTNYGGGADLNRTIWGQNDTGDDIDGSMTVHGDVHIKAIPEYVPDPDDDDEGEDEEREEGGGSLDVDLDVTVGRHLYINHPHPDHKGEKKCVGDLINGLDARVTTNEGNISSLNTTVSNHTTQITNLTNRVTTNEGNIADNADEIAKIKASNLTEDDVLKLIRDNQPSKLGNSNQPVILYAGQWTYNNNNIGGGWFEYPLAHLPHFYISKNSHKDGLMTFELWVEEGYRVNVIAAHATQYNSGDTTDKLDNPYIKGRSDGAHWFECRQDDWTNTKKIYVREFHQGNGDNDTWYSDNWNGDGGGIQSINLTLIGYITPPTT